MKSCPNSGFFTAHLLCSSSTSTFIQQAKQEYSVYNTLSSYTASNPQLLSVSLLRGELATHYLRLRILHLSPRSPTTYLHGSALAPIIQSYKPSIQIFTNLSAFEMYLKLQGFGTCPQPTSTQSSSQFPSPFFPSLSPLPSIFLSTTPRLYSPPHHPQTTSPILLHSTVDTLLYPYDSVAAFINVTKTNVQYVTQARRGEMKKSRSRTVRRALGGWGKKTAADIV